MQNDITMEEKQIIRIKIQQVKSRKVTKIENVPDEQKDVLLGILRKKMATGGTKQPDGTIQIQGDKTHSDIINIVKEVCDGHKVEMNGKVS